MLRLTRLIYQKSDFYIESDFTNSLKIGLGDRFSFFGLEEIKKQIDILNDWYFEKYVNHCLLKYGLNVDSKNKLVTIHGIKFKIVGENIVLDSRNFLILQDLLVNNYYD